MSRVRPLTLTVAALGGQGGAGLHAQLHLAARGDEDHLRCALRRVGENVSPLVQAGGRAAGPAIERR